MEMVIAGMYLLSVIVLIILIIGAVCKINNYIWYPGSIEPLDDHIKWNTEEDKK